MAKQNNPDTSKLDKKSQKADKLLDQFIESVKGKRTVIQGAAHEATSVVKSIRRSEKQSLDELTKIKTAVSNDAKLLGKQVGDAVGKTKSDISQAFSEVDSIRDDTKKSYGRFKRTYDAALNGATGINARRDDIVTRHNKIKATHKEIDELDASLHEKADEVATVHKDSLANQELITEVKNRAIEIRGEIEKTYQIATDDAMGGALNARKVEVQKALYFWRRALIGAVLLLVGAIGLLIYLSIHISSNANLLAAVTNRLVYLTPLLFVIFITYHQYEHERRILEEYAFKAALAQTLRNYAVLLSENYKQVSGAEGKILDFLLSTMTNIYDRSVLDNTSGFFYQLVVGSKHLGAQATVQEGVAEIKTTSKKIETKEEKKIESNP